MPRKDKSFHGGDIIRLLAKNLDSKEQDDVILFLYMVIPEIALQRLEDRIFGPSVAVPGLSRTFVSVAIRAVGLLRLLPNAFRRIIITRFMSQTARKEVDKAIRSLNRPLLGGPFRIRR